VLLLDESWFTFRTNINSQNKRNWCCENTHMVYEAPVCDKLEYCISECTRFIGPTFFKEPFSNLHLGNTDTIVGGRR
jgi:hypothetical protein